MAVPALIPVTATAWLCPPATRPFHGVADEVGVAGTEHCLLSGAPPEGSRRETAGFRLTEADFDLTEADFDLARRIDAIVAAHQTLPLDRPRVRRSRPSFPEDSVRLIAPDSAAAIMAGGQGQKRFLD
ncbi:hypothetical protein [Streptomyces tanashiensis]|uniref:hypothetical protein n=1 Tax=Streptomyces tanashiensis TaxID=67367 RepID=UPI0033FDAF15